MDASVSLCKYAREYYEFSRIFSVLLSNSPFPSSRDTTIQNLDFTRQTTEITHFAVVFHY